MDNDRKTGAELVAAIDEAEVKAIDALARYKFMMFGYHAAVWVSLNRISGRSRKSPFRPFVELARDIREHNASA